MKSNSCTCVHEGCLDARNPSTKLAHELRAWQPQAQTNKTQVNDQQVVLDVPCCSVKRTCCLKDLQQGGQLTALRFVLIASVHRFQRLYQGHLSLEPMPHQSQCSAGQGTLCTQLCHRWGGGWVVCVSLKRWRKHEGPASKK